jgi:hypothetical protein
MIYNISNYQIFKYENILGNNEVKRKKYAWSERKRRGIL